MFIMNVISFPGCRGAAKENGFLHALCRDDTYYNEQLSAVNSALCMQHAAGLPSGEEQNGENGRHSCGNDIYAGCRKI